MRGGTISQANRYLGGFCSSQTIFPPQIIQVLLTIVIAIVLWIVLWVLYFYLSNGTVPKEETPFLVVVAVVLTLAGKWLWRKARHRGNDG